MFIMQNLVNFHMKPYFPAENRGFGGYEQKFRPP